MEQKIKRRLFNRKFLLVLPLLSLLVMALPINTVSALSLTPSSTSSLVGVGVSFTATGCLTDGHEYSVKLAGTEVLSGLVANSAGIIVFSVTGATAGTFLVSLYNNASVLQGSSTLIVNDLFAMIMPYIVIFVGLTILFGIIKELKF